jgi:hypothetical protein
VCNKLGNHQCINPKRGSDGGDTWAKRLEEIDKDFPEDKKRLEDLYRED